MNVFHQQLSTRSGEAVEFIAFQKYSDGITVKPDGMNCFLNLQRMFEFINRKQLTAGSTSTAARSQRCMNTFATEWIPWLHVRA